MIKYCLSCGCKMNSKTNGWECPNCNCYQDANGNFHSSVFENKSSNMTNADKIRNMTDEELYDFISGIDIYRCTCPAKSICDEESCEANFIKWLKQPVEGE